MDHGGIGSYSVRMEKQRALRPLSMFERELGGPSSPLYRAVREALYKNRGIRYAILGWYAKPHPFCQVCSVDDAGRMECFNPEDWEDHERKKHNKSSASSSSSSVSRIRGLDEDDDEDADREARRKSKSRSKSRSKSKSRERDRAGKSRSRSRSRMRSRSRSRS